MKKGIWRQGAVVAIALQALLMSLPACKIDGDCDCECKGRCGADCQCVEYGDLFALQEEAKQNLRAIFTTEVAYFGENNTFSPKFSDIAWYPEGPTRYAYFLPGDSIQPTLTMAWHPPEGLGPGLNGYSFTIMAVSNIDCDPSLDVWTVDDSYHIKNVINDVYQ